MSDKSPTPDLLPRFQKRSHLDDAPRGVKGRDNHSQICNNALGPASPMDKASHGRGTSAQASLGNGGGRLNDAVASIKSGARTAKADFGFLRKG